MSQHAMYTPLDWGKQFNSLLPSPQSNTPTAPGGIPGIADGNFAVGNQYNSSGGLIPGTNQPQTDTGFSLGDWAKIGTGAVQAYTGYKSLGLQKDALDFSRNSFNTNLANQATVLNSQMEDRQRARMSFSGKYGEDEAGQASLQADLQSYLTKHKVSGAAI